MPNQKPETTSSAKVAEVKKIKQAAQDIEKASNHSAKKLEEAVAKIEKAEKKNEGKEKKMDAAVKKIEYKADKIEKCSRRNLELTFWITITIAVITTLINVALFIIRSKFGC